MDVYLPSQRAGLRSVHIVDPSAPYEHIPVNRPEYPIVGVDAEPGGFVAYTTYPSGFNVFQHLHIVQPKIGIMKVIPVRGTAQGIALRDKVAYIAAGNAGMRIFDVSGVSIPEEIGFSNKPGREDAFDVTLSGNLALIADRTVTDFDDYYRPGGMRIVDITDPTTPTELGNSKGDVWSVAIEGAHAILADYSRGRTHNTSSLDIVDITDPANPLRTASFTVPPEIKAPMVSVGTSVYVVDTHLRRFDLSDPEHPHLAWSLALPRDTYFRGRLPGLAVVGTYAFVGGGSAGLHVVDLSDPNHPTKITTIDIEAYDVIAEAGRVYASELFGGLSIVDTTDPATPNVVGTLQGNFSVGDMQTANNVLYIAPYPGASLIIYEVSNAAMPALLGYYGAGETIHHVDLSGDYAFLAVGDTEEHIEVVDISDPAQSQFVSEFPVAYPTISDMTLAGDSLYLTVPATPGGGLRVLDISNPRNLRREGNYKMRAEFAHAVAVLPGNVIAVGTSSGLMVLQELESAR